MSKTLHSFNLYDLNMLVIVSYRSEGVPQDQNIISSLFIYIYRIMNLSLDLKESPKINENR